MQNNASLSSGRAEKLFLGLKNLIFLKVLPSLGTKVTLGQCWDQNWTKWSNFGQKSHGTRPPSQAFGGPPNIGINVGYQKTDFLALVYPRDFRPFWGSNVPFSAPTSQNVVQCTLFGPIPKFSGLLGPNVPKSDLKHSITHFFQSKGQIFAISQ